MKVNIVTRPTIEPVSVREVKDHIRVDVADEDELIESILKSAREYVEDVTRRALLTQTWDYFLDAFPSENYIALPFGNLQSTGLSVKYKEDDWATSADDVTLTLGTDYLIETNGEGFGRIVLPYGETWPSFTAYPSNPITIRFVCGWTTAALVPYRIKSAIKITCADLFEQRGDPVLGQTVVENKTVERLLASCRLWGNFA